MKVIECRYKHQSAINWLAVFAWLLLARQLHLSDWIFFSVLLLLALLLNYRVASAGPMKDEPKES
jgi:hypothetical protein